MEPPNHLQDEIETLVRRRCVIPKHHVVRIWIDIEDPNNPQKPSRDAILATKLRGLVRERTANVLEDRGIYFVGQVCRLERKNLYKMRNVGPGTFRELELILRDYSLEFGYTGMEGPLEKASLATIGK